MNDSSRCIILLLKTLSFKYSEAGCIHSAEKIKYLASCCLVILNEHALLNALAILFIGSLFCILSSTIFDIKLKPIRVLGRKYFSGLNPSICFGRAEPFAKVASTIGS